MKSSRSRLLQKDVANFTLDDLKNAPNAQLLEFCKYHNFGSCYTKKPKDKLMAYCITKFQEKLLQLQNNVDDLDILSSREKQVVNREVEENLTIQDAQSILKRSRSPIEFVDNLSQTLQKRGKPEQKMVFDHIPGPALFEIMLNLDRDELFQLCTMNRTANKICQLRRFQERYNATHLIDLDMYYSKNAPEYAGSHIKCLSHTRHLVDDLIVTPGPLYIENKNDNGRRATIYAGEFDGWEMIQMESDDRDLDPLVEEVKRIKPWLILTDKFGWHHIKIPKDRMKNGMTLQQFKKVFLERHRTLYEIALNIKDKIEEKYEEPFEKLVKSPKRMAIRFDKLLSKDWKPGDIWLFAEKDEDNEEENYWVMASDHKFYSARDGYIPYQLWDLFVQNPYLWRDHYLIHGICVDTTKHVVQEL